MAATLVQSKSAAQNTGDATVDATWDAEATAGNLLIIIVGADDYAASPPTGFTQSTGCEQETFLGHYVWWKVAAGGETSATYTIGSAATSAWITMEYSGLESSPYDTSNGQLAASSATSYTTPSITPTSGDRLLIGSIGGSLNNTLSGVDTWTNSFTEQEDIWTTLGSGTRDVVGAADRAVTANGSTSYSTGASYTGATSCQSRTGIIIAFKVSAGGTDATPTPAAVATTATVPRPNVNAGAGPVALAATTTAPRPNVNVGAGPAVVAATTALARPDVNVSTGPTTVAAVTALPQPAVNVSASPSAVATTVALPTPTIDTAGNVTASPAVVATVATVPQPGVDISAGPAVIPVTVTVPQPGVNVGAGPAVIPCTVALATPTVDAGTGVSPATITTTIAVQATAVSVGASPATIAVTVTIPTPTTGALVKALSDPSVVHAVASVAAVTALRTSTPTALARATSTSTVG